MYANDFDSVKELWIGNQSALISRPRFWTFHDLVSKTQGVFTLGTSPWNDSVKKARKAAATALNRQAIQTYLPFINLEINRAINELLRNVRSGSEIDPNGYFQRLSLNVSLTLAFGLRIEGSVKDELLWEVVAVERELGNIRGVAHCWQDYVPFLRLFSQNHKKNAIEYRARRDRYIILFYEQLRTRITEGTDNPCIAGNMIKDPEAKLTESRSRSHFTMLCRGTANWWQTNSKLSL